MLLGMPPISTKVIIGIVLGTLALCHLTRSWTPLAVLIVTAAFTAMIYPMMSM